MKRCLRQPISDIFGAAHDLNEAVSAHLAGDYGVADALIARTNTETLRAYINSLWGAKSEYVKPTRAAATNALQMRGRSIERMPPRSLQLQLIERDGYHCRYCGIPLVSPEVRKRIASVYPQALPWGRSNASQHAAFQVLWLQFDHVVPHAHGGDNSLDNLVIACAGCNFGKMYWTLEELGLEDPRLRDAVRSPWDGLERFVAR